jgi:uncharacterized protein (DUF2252 family)
MPRRTIAARARDRAAKRAWLADAIADAALERWLADCDAWRRSLEAWRAEFAPEPPA